MDSTRDIQRRASGGFPGACRFSFLAFVFTLILGLLVGSTLTAWIHRVPPSIHLQEDVDDNSVAVVRIEGIRNNALQGTAEGDVRIVADGSIVPVNASGAFVIKNTNVLTNIIHIDIPAGMQFVASSRGKKYYPVDSASAQNLSLDHRIYFTTAAEAEAAGYHR